MLGELDPTNPDDGRDPYGQEPPSYPGSPPSGVPPPPSAPAGAPASFAYTGKATQALIAALYPGYSLQNGQLVWTGNGAPSASAGAFGNSGTDTQYAVNRINSFADPLAAQDYRAFFQHLYGSNQASQSSLLDPARRKILEAAGFHITPANKEGAITKIQKPGATGQSGWVRVLKGDPNNGAEWDWVEQPDGPTPPPTPYGGTGTGIDPSYLSPWDKAFNFEGFQAPNDEELHADPGFKFRRDNAVGAYQNSSAARGLLNSSNAPYDIATLADSLAGQEYGNVFSRKFGTWQTNRDNAWQKYLNEQDTFRQNQNAPFDKLFKSSELGLNAAGS